SRSSCSRPSASWFHRRGGARWRRRERVPKSERVRGAQSLQCKREGINPNGGGVMSDPRRRWARAAMMGIAAAVIGLGLAACGGGGGGGGPKIALLLPGAETTPD